MAKTDILVTVGANISDFSRKMANVSKTLSNAGKNMSDMGRNLSNIGTQLTNKITKPAVAAATAVGGITLAKGFQRLVGIDTARAKLEALGHDAKNVDLIMTNALDAVRGTAYGLDEAATAAASAVAAGIKPGKELHKYLTLVGDAAAIAGTDFNEMASIFNKVQTAQRAYTGDLNMLADRGIPIYQWLAEEAGTSAEAIRDMASRGEVSSEMFRQAIDKNIGGAAKTIGEKSFAAALRNVGADIARIGANFLDAGGEAGGFFSTVKPMITEFRGYLQSLEPRAAELGKKFGEFFIRTVERLKQFKAWWDSLSPTMQSVISKAVLFGSIFLVSIGPALKIVGAFTSTFGKLFLATSKTIDVFKKIRPALKFMMTGFKGIRTAILGLSGPWGWVIAAVILLAGVIIKYWKPISNFVKNLWNRISDAFTNGFKAVDNATNGWLSNLIGVYKAYFKTIVDVIKRFWQAVKETFSNALDFLKALITLDFGGMKDAIVAQFKTIKSFFADSWSIAINNMRKPLDKLGDSIQKTFSNVFKWIDTKTHGFFGKYVKLWGGQFKAIYGVVKSAWQFIKDTFSNALEFLKGLVTLDFGRMKDAISDQLDTIKTFVSEAWTNIKDNIWENLVEIVKHIGDKFVEAREKIMEKLEELKEGILEWFRGMPDKIVETLEGWRDAMIEWAEKQNEENIRQFEEWGSAIRDWFHSIPEKLGEWLNTWRTKITDWFTETKENIKTKLNEWKTTVSDWFKSRPSEIYAQLLEWWNKMAQWFSEIPSKIKTKLEEWWTAIKEWFTGVPDKPEIKNAGEKMIDKVSEGNEAKKKDFLTKLGRLIVDVIKAALILAAVALFAAGREIVRDIIDGVVSMFSNMRQKAWELIQNAIEAIKQVNLWGVGRDLIRGLINGVGSMAGSLWSKARELASGIGRTIKNALGVRSPSRVAMEIGRFVGQGLGIGILDMKRYVERASDELATAAVPDIDMSYATPSGIKTSLASAVSGTVDVKSRDDALVHAIYALERRLTNLEVVMDGREVGRLVEPYVTEEQERNQSVMNRFRG